MSLRGADGARALRFARGVVQDESLALAALARGLDASFVRAVELIVACANAHGTVLVSGLGKSGLVGAKISATLASLGIPSHPVHPTEAVHGDLGRFRPSDVAICISNSGETDEVVGLAAILRQDGLPIIAITGSARAKSSLARLATVSLALHVEHEAGATEGLAAPTSSTTATLALGDALAVTAARVRRFTSGDFARRHPGGTLGGLLRPVTEVMRWRAGKNLPLLPSSLRVDEALAQAAAQGRRPGALMLVTAGGKLAGIFTDGDLRRLVIRDAGELRGPISRVMTRSPRTLRDSTSVRDAVAMFREHRQDEIPIVDARGRPVGLLDVQDLIAMRLVKE